MEGNGGFGHLPTSKIPRIKTGHLEESLRDLIEGCECYWKLVGSELELCQTLIGKQLALSERFRECHRVLKKSFLASIGAWKRSKLEAIADQLNEINFLLTTSENLAQNGMTILRKNSKKFQKSLPKMQRALATFINSWGEETLKELALPYLMRFNAANLPTIRRLHEQWTAWDLNSRLDHCFHVLQLLQ